MPKLPVGSSPNSDNVGTTGGEPEPPLPEQDSSEHVEVSLTSGHRYSVVESHSTFMAEFLAQRAQSREVTRQEASGGRRSLLSGLALAGHGTGSGLTRRPDFSSMPSGLDQQPPTDEPAPLARYPSLSNEMCLAMLFPAQRRSTRQRPSHQQSSQPAAIMEAAASSASAIFAAESSQAGSFSFRQFTAYSSHHASSSQHRGAHDLHALIERAMDLAATAVQGRTQRHREEALLGFQGRMDQILAALPTLRSGNQITTIYPMKMHLLALAELAQTRVDECTARLEEIRDEVIYELTEQAREEWQTIHKVLKKTVRKLDQQLTTLFTAPTLWCEFPIPEQAQIEAIDDEQGTQEWTAAIETQMRQGVADRPATYPRMISLHHAMYNQQTLDIIAGIREHLRTQLSIDLCPAEQIEAVLGLITPGIFCQMVVALNNMLPTGLEFEVSHNPALPSVAILPQCSAQVRIGYGRRISLSISIGFRPELRDISGRLSTGYTPRSMIRLQHMLTVETNGEAISSGITAQLNLQEQQGVLAASGASMQVMPFRR